MIALPLNPAAFDAAIIDLDGTMVDTLGDFAQALGTDGPVGGLRFR